MKNIEIKDGKIYLSEKIKLMLYSLLVYDSDYYDLCTKKDSFMNKDSLSGLEFGDLINHICDFSYRADNVFWGNSDLIPEYDKLSHEFKKKEGDFNEFRYCGINYNKDVPLDDIELYITLLYKINMIFRKIFIFNTIVNLDYKEIETNIKTISDKKLVKKYLKTLNSLKEAGKTEEFIDFVSLLNNRFKLEYIDKMNPPKYEGEDFMFIGHSVHMNARYENFKTKYISCCLFNPYHMLCYRQKYGFIMDPAYMVAASNKDLLTQNRMKRDNEIILKRTMPYIRPLKILMDDHNANERRSYTDNEIVIKGFKPLGIFNFTYGIADIEQDSFEGFVMMNKGYKVYEFDLLELAKDKCKDVVRKEFLEIFDIEISEIKNIDKLFAEISARKKEGPLYREETLTIIRKYVILDKKCYNKY